MKSSNIASNRRFSYSNLNMKITQNGKGDAEEEMDHDGAESEKSSAEEESPTCSTEEDQEDESHSGQSFRSHVGYCPELKCQALGLFH